MTTDSLFGDPKPKSRHAKPYYALGHKKPDEMNDTERRYAEHLEQRKQAGEVAWWKFNSMKFRLAHNTFVTVDFAVMLDDGRLQMHDVKGSMMIYEQDARVKMKVAAEMYPFEFYIAIPRRKKDGGGWEVTKV